MPPTRALKNIQPRDSIGILNEHIVAALTSPHHLVNSAGSFIA